MALSIKLGKSLNHAKQLSPIKINYARYMSTNRNACITRRLFANKVKVPTSFVKSVSPLLSLSSTPSCSLRWMSASNRTHCSKDKTPRCTPKKLAQSPCAERKKKEKDNIKSPFHSMWENPECCDDPCPDVLPRFDELYYQMSDKAKRKYNQTWKECPKLKIAPRKVCCLEGLQKPPFVKRPRKERPHTACSTIKSTFDLMVCKRDSNSKCPRKVSSGCLPARMDAKCKTERKPSNCKKICTPYPSFSECRKPKSKQFRPVECKCLDVRPMCAVWAAWRKMLTRQK